MVDRARTSWRKSLKKTQSQEIDGEEETVNEQEITSHREATVLSGKSNRQL